jgi:hypothetical protein
MKARGYWLASADKFLVGIDAALSAQRTQVSRRIAIERLARKDRLFGKVNLPTNTRNLNSH